ncbi:hypothetical protein TraAM80_05261 [Trypanosoma rangeli]|uniref:Uncharacterized protein n=1 Tax=Trypanosoma rangeli TaxID=5698 RepID=A0A3R7KAK1_TRYRA|nr:uncharacterized protein TraAM80_05261 [Trypanosoma rangeli]RNF04382.1 hypothetical protein TraAM80_05261 [Trypanosoma rangeli]|eukprot:RNF04382.1 hypothetical protein TraAM80_05261 [Trypanosoma rangeli]
MSTPLRHALRRLGAPHSPAATAAVRHAASLRRRACWPDLAPPLETFVLSHNNTAMREDRRSLFKNQKTFPVGGEAKLHADDIAVTAKNRKLFGDAASHDGPGNSRDDMAMPTAAELDKILPTAKQLQNEIPSAAAVRNAMQEGQDAAMWKGGDDDDEV